MNTEFLFMAIAKGTESTESAKVTRYYGIAPVYVLDINPSKEALEKLYGTTINDDPTYIGTTSDADGNEIAQVRLDFIVKTDKDKCGVDMITKVTFFITNQYRFNKDKSKVQVIDKYGRTAWVTKDEMKNHTIPTYSSGPANLDKDYRPCYRGEENVTKFLKTYLGIPNPMKYVDGTWIPVDNLEDCEIRLDNIADYFKGDFSELQGAIKLQPNNKVKVLFGVKTTADNKLYQTVYTEMFLNNRATKLEALEKDVNERKAAGAYQNIEFVIDGIREYTVEPTTFTTSNSEMPEIDSSVDTTSDIDDFPF